MPARAGTTTPFFTGTRIGTLQAQYNSEHAVAISKEGVRRGQTAEVGSFHGNAFGLNDMHGNVAEWVEDCFTDSLPKDASAYSPPACNLHTVRGGSWMTEQTYLRSASRSWEQPANATADIGFRVARTLTP